MVTYVQTADASDIAPSWPSTSLFDNDMIEGATGNGNFSISVPASTTRAGAFITVANKPNNNAFEDGGTQTVELDVMMGDADVTGKCRCVRVDSGGTILGVKGSFTSTQVMDVSRTFSPVSPTWTGVESCSDRFAIEFEFIESAGMNATLQFNIRVTTAEVISDISEEVGACVAAAVQFPLIVNQSVII